MAEELKINIDLATAEAAQNGQALIPVLTGIKTEATEVATAVGKADTGLDQLADSAKKAGGTAEQAAAGAKELAKQGQQVADSATTAAKAVDKLGEAADKAADDLKDNAQASDKAATAQQEVADAAKNAATNVQAAGSAAEGAAAAEEKMADAADKAAAAQQNVAKTAPAAAAAAKDIGTAAEDAGRKVDNAGDAGKKGTKKIADGMGEAKDKTGLAGKALDDVKGILLSFGTAGFGLQVINKVLEELNARARNLAKALEELGQKQISTDADFKDILDNLQLGGDDAAVQRARKFGLKFAAETGSTPKVAAQILAAAQPTFPVIDPKRPETDGQLPGYGIAKVLSEFAGRTGLDDQTAGNIIKIFAQENVKSQKDALKVLSQLEAGMNSTLITSPRAYLESVIPLAAGRPAGTLATTLGQFSAAAGNDPSPERAKTKVEQFRAAALGDPSKLPALGKLALDNGVITQEQVNAAMPASDKAGDFQRRREAIARGETDAARELKERELRLKAAQDGLKRDREKLTAEMAVPASAKSTPEQQAVRDLGFKDRQAELDQRGRSVKVEQAKIVQDRTDAAAKNKAARDDLSEGVKKDDAVRLGKGLAAAYSQLTPQAREEMLQKVFAGKDEKERLAILANITEAQEGRAGVNAVTSDTAQKSFVKARDAVLAADPASTDRLNQERKRNNATGRAAVQAATALQSQVSAAPGADSVVRFNELATQDKTILDRDPSVKSSSFFPFTSKREDRSLYAFTDNQRTNQRKAAIVVATWQKLRNGLSPKTRAAIGDDKITEFDRYIMGAYNDIMNTTRLTSNDANAASMAQAYGAFEQRVSQIASSVGDLLPATDVPLGRELPLDLSGQPFGSGAPNIPTDAAGVLRNETGGPPAAPSLPDIPAATPATAPAGPPAPKASVGQSPSASAAGITNVYNSNTYIGTHVGQLPGNYDFPGRLEDA